jgi:hypothetical protein
MQSGLGKEEGRRTGGRQVVKVEGGFGEGEGYEVEVVGGEGPPRRSPRVGGVDLRGQVAAGAAEEPLIVLGDRGRGGRRGGKERELAVQAPASLCRPTAAWQGTQEARARRVRRGAQIQLHWTRKRRPQADGRHQRGSAGGCGARKGPGRPNWRLEGPTQCCQDKTRQTTNNGGKGTELNRMGLR